jgi:hypothetical protein
MDSAITQEMLAHLRAVDAQRQLRNAEPGLSARVQRLKLYQQQRFSRTYADLLNTPRYEKATQFFLQELYGPGDFSRRDAQFARVVPALVRIFPVEVVATVAKLARLHAISERMDTRMAQQLGAAPLNASNYIAAWQACGEALQRQLQIELTIAVGASLEQLTRKPLLRQGLRLMRGPATAAGMGELQRFLETGFDTFREMRGTTEFLQLVRQREEALAEALLKPGAAALLRQSACHTGDDPLGQLP